ncbi:hypothetical protein SFRURICE_007486 [Spodoptera frugiperda]|nr:hypothetical protein SFRURICE_007486 [Spodoptera frugiperda]
MSLHSWRGGWHTGCRATCSGFDSDTECDPQIFGSGYNVQSPILVVELNLNRIEGTQLRALGLLAVYGFNVTYEVRPATQAPGPSSCSAIECRLLGHCYARHDYQEFYCSCFDGYSGVDCGVGPLCPTTSNMCKNGGTCRQMGPAAVSCICAPGYTGDLCEAQVAAPGEIFIFLLILTT